MPFTNKNYRFPGRWGRRGVLLIAASLLIGAGCDEKKSPPKRLGEKADTSGPEPAGSDQRVVEFGGRVHGFVDWLERDGRFVILHRFTEDTDGDGEIDPRLGDHGEPTGDWPVVTSVNLRSGKSSEWDELLATDPQGRWAALRRDEKVFLVSANDRLELKGADVTPDPSPCMPARQAAFDPSGTWVGFVRSAPERAVVRHLRTGEEREYRAKGKLWRADPTPLGWAVLREVSDTNADGEVQLPVRKGSCVCRWCGRFAKSIGSAGFAGDDFESILVDPKGKRHEGFRQPLPVAPGYVWSLVDSELKTVGGESVQVGGEPGCRLLALPVGSTRMILRCGSDTRIWDPGTGKAVPVEARLDALELYAAPRSGWLPVRLHEKGGTRLGRLNVDTGEVEPGPPARRFGTPHPSGWLLAAGEQAMWAYDVHSGTATKLGPLEGALHPLLIERGEKWLVVDPSTGKFTRLDEQPAFIDSNGCFVEPHEMSRPREGPFRYVCP